MDKYNNYNDLLKPLINLIETCDNQDLSKKPNGFLYDNAMREIDIINENLKEKVKSIKLSEIVERLKKNFKCVEFKNHTIYFGSEYSWFGNISIKNHKIIEVYKEKFERYNIDFFYQLKIDQTEIIIDEVSNE